MVFTFSAETILPKPADLPKNGNLDEEPSVTIISVSDSNGRWKIRFEWSEEGTFSLNLPAQDVGALPEKHQTHSGVCHVRMEGRDFLCAAALCVQYVPYEIYMALHTRLPCKTKSNKINNLAKTLWTSYRLDSKFDVSHHEIRTAGSTLSYPISSGTTASFAPTCEICCFPTVRGPCFSVCAVFFITRYQMRWSRAWRDIVWHADN